MLPERLQPPFAGDQLVTLAEATAQVHLCQVDGLQVLNLGCACTSRNTHGGCMNESLRMSGQTDSSNLSAKVAPGDSSIFAHVEPQTNFFCGVSKKVFLTLWAFSVVVCTCPSLSDFRSACLAF